VVPGSDDLTDALETFLLEVRVSHGQHLVDQEDIRLE
jgi:hypothetical protein